MTRDLTKDYLDILRAYEPGDRADEMEREYENGLDITDALYEALCEYDEAAAEGFLDKEDAPLFPDLSDEGGFSNYVRRPGYKSLDAAYQSGFNAFMDGEPDNLWSPYATEDEKEMWRIGWNDGRNMRQSEEAWEEETKRVSESYRKFFDRTP